MKGKGPITPENFLSFTNLQDMVSNETRAMVASHVARLRRAQRDQGPVITREKIAQSFSHWRDEDCRGLQQPAREIDCRRDECTHHDQAVARICQLLDEVSACLHLKLSLQQFLEAMQANPLDLFPNQISQIIPDKGIPTSSSPITNANEIYHAVMGMLLSWLSKRYPTKYPLSAALHYHGLNISRLRYRLSQRKFNEETFVNVLCAVQTEAILGNEKAMAAHRAGLEVISHLMAGRSSVQNLSMKAKRSYNGENR